MKKTVSICGYHSSGSSAFVDVLREFDDVKIMDDSEFWLLHIDDCLADLDYHVNTNLTTASSTVAIHRFRRAINKMSFCMPRPNSIDRDKLKNATEEYLQQIIMCSYKGRIAGVKILEQDTIFVLIKKIVHKVMKTIYPPHQPPLFNLELSINPPDFDEITRKYVVKMLNIIYKTDGVEEDQEVRVIDQLFPVRNTENYFKYVENPAAVIIDRDPRDHYLFGKKFFAPRGKVLFPCDNVDSYIRYFKTTRQISQSSLENKNIAFFKFEELVYDCDNTVKRLAHFLGLTNRVRKGECFKPAHSRNNSQLFKKYPEYEADIKKIEKELPDFLFPFENYPDIVPEGDMFYGSQKNKKYK